MNPSPDPDSLGWVLYDGSCGFCSRWLPFWGPTLKRRGFGFAPLQADWVRERLPGEPDLGEGEGPVDLLLLMRDGTVVRGAAVYRFFMRRVWWAIPAYGLSVLPGTRWLFERSYRAFADHRHRISRICRLDPHG